MVPSSGISEYSGLLVGYLLNYYFLKSIQKYKIWVYLPPFLFKKKKKKKPAKNWVFSRSVLLYFLRWVGRWGQHNIFLLGLNINACIKGHLEPTHLKSSPLFTFSTKSLGQDSPSIHLFSKIIGSSFTTAKIKLGEDSPSWFVFFLVKIHFKIKKIIKQ